MKISRTRPFGLRLVATLATPLVVLFGCAGGDTPTIPTAGGEVPTLSHHAGHTVPAGPAVQGGGFFAANTGTGWIYNISVSASVGPGGEARGSILLRSRTAPGNTTIPVDVDWSAMIEVDCLEVEGTMAWVGGTVTASRTESPFGPPLGGDGLLIIQDNGPGPVDVANTGPAAIFGAVDCRDRPPLLFSAPLGTMTGNYSVRGD